MLSCWCCCCWSSNAEKDDGLCASFVRKKKSPCNASAPHMCVGLYRVLQFGTQLVILCAVSSGTDFWGWNAHADHMFDKCFGRNIIPDSFFVSFSPLRSPWGRRSWWSRLAVLILVSPKSPTIIVTLKRKRERRQQTERDSLKWELRRSSYGMRVGKRRHLVWLEAKPETEKKKKKKTKKKGQRVMYDHFGNNSRSILTQKAFSVYIKSWTVNDDLLVSTKKTSRERESSRSRKKKDWITRVRTTLRVYSIHAFIYAG